MFKRFFTLFFSFLILATLGCGDQSSSTLSQDIVPTVLVPIWIADLDDDDDPDQSGRVPSDYSSYPFNTVGKVGSCTAVLLTPRIALTSAHCLMSKELNIFDSSKEALFYISDTSIEIKTAILGTTRIPENPLSADRYRDWAFLILDSNSYTSTLKFLGLGFFGGNWFKANLFGMNKDQNLVYNHEAVILEDKNDQFQLSKSSDIYGENSGIIVTNNVRIVGLMSSDFELRTPTDSFVVNVSLPISSAVEKTFYKLKSLFKSKPNPTSEDIKQALSKIRYYKRNNVKDTLVIYDREQAEFLTLNSSGIKSLPLPFKHPRMYLTKSFLGCYLYPDKIDLLLDAPSPSPVIFNTPDEDTLLEQNPKSIASKD